MLLLIAALIPVALYGTPSIYKSLDEVPMGLRGEYAWRSRQVPIQDSPPSVVWGPYEVPDLRGLNYGYYGMEYNGLIDRLYSIYIWQNWVKNYSSVNAADPMMPETTYMGSVCPVPEATDSFQDLAYSRYNNCIWLHSSKWKRVYKIHLDGTPTELFSSPARQYPTGIAFDERAKKLYLIDRMEMGGVQGVSWPESIYVCDTLMNVLQRAPLTDPQIPWSYAGARCLDFDYSNTNANWPTLLMTYSIFDSFAGLDDIILFELDRTNFQVLNKVTLPYFWLDVPNARGVAWDPRTGDYWIGIMQDLNATYDNYVYKMDGWHQPIQTLDAAVLTIQRPRGPVNQGDAITPRAEIRNFSSTAQTIPVRMKIGATYNMTTSISLNANSENWVTFPNWNATTPGRFEVRCSTELTNDVFAKNDLWTDSVFVSGVYLDVGCTHILAPTGMLDSGTSVTPACSVYNWGTSSVGYSVRMKIGADYNAVANVAGHGPNTRLYVTFGTPWSAHPRGLVSVSCSTELATDMAPNNDKLTGNVLVSVTDVGCTHILAPAGVVDSGTSVTPACSVYNYGITTPGSYTVRMKIGTVYDNPITISGPAPGTRVYVTFPSWIATPLGTFGVSCSTELALDLNHPNDKATGSAQVVAPARTDVGCSHLLAPSGTIDSGGSATPACSVANFGTLTPGSYTVRMKIGTLYNQTVGISGPGPGGKLYVEFPGWTASERGSLAVSCSTELASDEVPANDKATGSVFVNVMDVGATEILDPVGVVDSDEVVTPVAIVHNYGTQNASFDVELTIGSLYSDTESVVDLAPGAEDTVDFADWTAEERGLLAVKCTTQFDGDMRTANDKVTGTVTVAVHDVGAVAIVAPRGTIDTMPKTPQATVHNFGSVNETFDAQFWIFDSTGAEIYTAFATATDLAPGASTPLSFTQWGGHHDEGRYFTRCSTLLADVDPANDAVNDSFVVTAAYVDVGAMAIIEPTGIRDTFPKTPQATVKNFSANSQTFDVVFRILNSGGTEVYSGTTQAVDLGPDSSVTLSFSVWGGHHPVGDYTARCSTALGDNNPDNDTCSGPFTVTSARIDVGALAIVVPTDTIDTFPKIPRAVVKNFGETALTFNVVFRILDNTDAEVYSGTAQATGLAPDSSVMLAFPVWGGHHPEGDYTARCSTALGDAYPENDVVSSSFYVWASAIVDVGATAIVNPTGVIDTLPEVPRATVQNFGDVRQTFVTWFQILDSTSTEVYSGSSLLINLLPGVPTLAAFPTWGGHHEEGWYTARCSTALYGDYVPDNDTVSDRFLVSSRVSIDVGATAIDGPTGIIDTLAKTPQATVKNFGLGVQTFMTTFRILDNGGAEVYSDTATATDLVPGASVTLSFPSWVGSHPTGNYTARCSTMLGDLYPRNDTVSGRFTVSAHPPIASGWHQKADMLYGPKSKRVKDGAALAYYVESDTDYYLYAFKGNGRYEFYRYSIMTNTWTSKESIPAQNAIGKKKGVKKGGTLTEADGFIYGTKGNNTIDFWQYNPHSTGGYPWVQKADVPVGMRKVKEGTGAVRVIRGANTYIYLLKGSNTLEFYRYNTGSNAWEPVASAPAGLSGRNFKNGSCITFNGDNTIYALKASYNEFFAYNVDSNFWATKTGLPLIGASGRKKKVKDGAGIAFDGRRVYGLKGGNTQEFWFFNPDSNVWHQSEDIPIGGGKRVKGGGCLVRGDVFGQPVFWAFKGNNTFEFWQYVPAATLLSAAPAGSEVMSRETRPTSNYELRIAPNPFRGEAEIRYSLARPGIMSLRLFDVTGKLVATLHQGYGQAGSYAARLNARELARGIYLLKLETEGYHTTQKLILE
jgi:hypothetical protein